MNLVVKWNTFSVGIKLSILLIGCLGWLYGISTFVGYLTPNQFLYK